MEDVEADIKVLKDAIHYCFFTNTTLSTGALRSNQERLKSILKRLGFPRIYTALLKDILDGKYDEEMKKNYKLEFSRYGKYLRNQPSVLDIKDLITRYFYFKNSNQYSKEDTQELRDVIVLLLRRIGVVEEIPESFLKDFQNGEYDDYYFEEKSKIARQKRLEMAYQNKEENWDEFCEAFYDVFDPFIDVYSIGKEDMIKLAEEKIGKDDKNVLR